MAKEISHKQFQVNSSASPAMEQTLLLCCNLLFWMPSEQVSSSCMLGAGRGCGSLYTWGRIKLWCSHTKDGPLIVQQQSAKLKSKSPLRWSASICSSKQHRCHLPSPLLRWSSPLPTRTVTTPLCQQPCLQRCTDICLPRPSCLYDMVADLDFHETRIKSNHIISIKLHRRRCQN